MREVQLTKSGLMTTEIGFGCSSLLGGTSKNEAIKLLETAFEKGIRHFDVARYYGFGDAEKILGDFAHNKRQSLTIVTKFGMLPDPRIAEMGGTIRVIRSLMRRFNWIKRIVRKNVRSVIQHGKFDIVTASKSLEDSLASLKTDYIDVLLLHDCQINDVTPEIYDFLLKAQSDGKIREFGIGTGFDHAKKIIEEKKYIANVTQFQSDIFNSNRKHLGHDVSGVITHGAFNCFSRLKDAFPHHDDEYISRLILSHACNVNKNGVLLFRTTNIGRLKKNLDIYAQNPMSPEEINHALESLRIGYN